MNNHSPIEQVVMRRVRLIRILGLIISTAVLAVLTLVLALWGIGQEVWVARVFQNAPADITDLPRFYLAAFNHTRLVVQILALLTFISFLYLLRATARALSSFFTPKLGHPVS
jgi:hypothetical protein